MTTSYSEISFDSPPPSSLRSLVNSPDVDKSEENYKMFNSTCVRPDHLDLKRNNEFAYYESNSKKYYKAADYLMSEGTVMKDGDLVLFVAEDLENKIKLSSPIAKKIVVQDLTDTKNHISHLQKLPLEEQLYEIDPNILNELENEARGVATSVDSITESLSAILHSASALTVGCLETYRDAVCKTCDTIDFNIKSIYQLMAKSEELSKSMKIIYTKSEKIKDLKKMVDLFESTMI
ncbi:BLOC-1-related complex subunit 6 isoform X2 [Phymastichus coffea]|nr:BLOC-1-related complex subunit 6 isoform X2 [Phymastichus coffea]